MTPSFPWRPVALIVCAPMIANCAGLSSISTVAPPRLDLPETARRPCALATLPAEPTQADLEIAYATRGAQIVACDGARRLAVEALEAERRMIDALSPRRGQETFPARLWRGLTRQN